jgi:glycosyltransferase involved in cell wall biosynthesis
VNDAAGIVTVSDYNRDHLIRTLGPDAARARRIYNGLDMDEFARSESRARPLGGPEVIAVGRLVEKKGFDDLIRACAVLKRSGTNVRCVIVGSGPLEPALRSMVESLGLSDRVRLTGTRPRAEVIQLVRGASALAAPCVVGTDGNRDGLPTVLLEAMALGTPCVSTPVTGIPEVVRDGETGLLVPERDPGALAGAIKRIASDRALATSLGQAGRALVERAFDIHRNTAAMREMFSECMNGAKEMPGAEQAGEPRGAVA